VCSSTDNLLPALLGSSLPIFPVRLLSSSFGVVDPVLVIPGTDPVTLLLFFSTSSNGTRRFPPPLPSLEKTVLLWIRHPDLRTHTVQSCASLRLTPPRVTFFFPNRRGKAFFSEHPSLSPTTSLSVGTPPRCAVFAMDVAGTSHHLAFSACEPYSDIGLLFFSPLLSPNFSSRFADKYLPTPPARRAEIRVIHPLLFFATSSSTSPETRIVSNYSHLEIVRERGVKDANLVFPTAASCRLVPFLSFSTSPPIPASKWIWQAADPLL